MKIWKLFFLGFFFLAGTCFATAAAPTVASEVVRDGVFIHLSRSYEDPHRVLMALWLAEKMSTMLALPEAQRRAMGAAGRCKVEDKYAWEAIGECLENVYQQVVIS